MNWKVLGSGSTRAMGLKSAEIPTQVASQKFLVNGYAFCACSDCMFRYLNNSKNKTAKSLHESLHGTGFFNVRHFHPK
ncbi:hypothetical protein [Polaromonas sp. CG_9.11]|uniref:hypothetical protein n=1 Tax=Polaromonas sp. CG_9.11 TaxID=2787730 RepID=UPI001E337CE1|nr:hypothetical protein [Polaromonas sp. CG_9.11]